MVIISVSYSSDSECTPVQMSARITTRIEGADEKASSKKNNMAAISYNRKRTGPRKIDVVPTSKKRGRVEKTNNDEVVQKKRSREEKSNDDDEVVQKMLMKLKKNLEALDPYERVKKTMRTFNKMYQHFVPIEENRCRKGNQIQNNNSKLKGIMKSKRISRPDLKTVTTMKKANAILYPEKQVGELPGIAPGHKFFSRSEMFILGFHHQTIKGIDYIAHPPKTTKNELVLKVKKFPIAVSIIMSGQYEDNSDNGDEILYTGEGGNDLLRKKHQVQDQKMEGGNMALKNCMDQCVPVRVVRGCKCKESYTKKVYTYVGLYKVVEHLSAKGVSDHLVQKFRLLRIDQGTFTKELQALPELCNIAKKKGKKRKLRKRFICEDLSRGLEDIAVRVSNTVDDTPTIPEDFTYIKSMQISKNVDGPTIAAVGCKCRGKCVDERTCACAKFNGGEFPYVEKDGGRLLEPKDVIFECGPQCGCGPECGNRISQKGLRYRLEVFRTPNKGWGVRSLDDIPIGALVCEYIGLLKRTDEVDPTAGDTYLFDIDCLETMQKIDGRESRLGSVSLPSHVQHQLNQDMQETEFCIDGQQCGNVTRFINHSCEPNLYVQCVVNEHHDLRFARVILVASDNIPALEELSYDYGYALNSVRGPDGKIRKLYCLCGAQNCRKRLY